MKRWLQFVAVVTLLVSLNSCASLSRTLGTVGRTMGTRSGGSGIYY